MKTKFLLLLPLFAMVVGCSSTYSRVEADDEDAPKVINFDDLEANDFNPTSIGGELGSFDLLSPNNGIIVDSMNEFSWTSSENADRYSLELCSDDRFINNNARIDYYLRENISATSFTINASLWQDTTYYWRVYAFNKDGERLSESTYSFKIKAPDIEEYEFDFGDADDWTLHPVGSYADISIDNSNFFGNNKESLVVSFKKEDTNQGIPESDGWIIVTKTIEKSIFGTDALFFNMYYSGEDANVLIRLVDRDNEYWYAPVQISNNAKQKVVLRFDDFVQRKKDVTIANETFDHERIKYLEVVFER